MICFRQSSHFTLEIYNTLKKYLLPLMFSTFCHIKAAKFNVGIRNLTVDQHKHRYIIVKEK